VTKNGGKNAEECARVRNRAHFPASFTTFPNQVRTMEIKMKSMHRKLAPTANAVHRMPRTRSFTVLGPLCIVSGVNSAELVGSAATFVPTVHGFPFGIVRIRRHGENIQW
jgi:hypothetical protein